MKKEQKWLVKTLLLKWTISVVKTLLLKWTISVCSV